MLNSDPSITSPAATSATKIFDLLIIGGGLSGLMAAHEMHRGGGGLNWKLLEARSKLGGRLENDAKGHLVDLGGAWIWPRHQPHMRKLTESLGSIQTFPQPDDPSSTRIEGGAVEVINALSQNLPPERIQLNSPVVTCTLMNIDDNNAAAPAQQQQCKSDGTTTNNDQSAISVTTASNETLLAKYVIFAVPPKLLSKHVTFQPALSKEKQEAMDASQTWMAGVTKISLIYPRRFWSYEASNMGFPASMGPAFQVYDASTKDSKISALTFFTLADSKTSDTKLADEVSTQLALVWNHYGLAEAAKQAKSYTDAHVKRWPLEKYISEDKDPTRINAHPLPVAALSKNEWGDRLLFAGTETDRTSPGVMEGAVGAALRVTRILKAILEQTSSSS